MYHIHHELRATASSNWKLYCTHTMRAGTKWTIEVIIYMCLLSELLVIVFVVFAAQSSFTAHVLGGPLLYLKDL